MFCLSKLVAFRIIDSDIDSLTNKIILTIFINYFMAFAIYELVLYSMRLFSHSSNLVFINFLILILDFDSQHIDNNIIINQFTTDDHFISSLINHFKIVVQSCVTTFYQVFCFSSKFSFVCLLISVF